MLAHRTEKNKCRRSYRTAENEDSLRQGLFCANEAILHHKIKQKSTHLASGTWLSKTTLSRPNIKLVERTAERENMNIRSKTAKSIEYR